MPDQGGAGSTNTYPIPRDVAILTTNSNQLKVGQSAATASTQDYDVNGALNWTFQDPALDLIYGGAGAAGLDLSLFHDSASPADGDTQSIKFDFNDDGDTRTTFGSIIGEIQDPSAASEDGIMRFKVMENTSLTEYMRLDGTSGTASIVFSKPVVFSESIFGGEFKHFVSMFDFENEYASYDVSTTYVHPTATGDRIRATLTIPTQMFGKTVHIEQITAYGRANDSAADFDFSLIAIDLDGTISFPFSESNIWNGESGTNLSTNLLGGAEDFDLENKAYFIVLNVNNTSTPTDVYFYGFEFTYTLNN